MTNTSITTTSFKENILFTHRGLSGPAILQISSYWQPGEDIHLDLLPDQNIEQQLLKPEFSGKTLKTLVGQLLPKSLVAALLPTKLGNTPIKSLLPNDIQQVNTCLHHLSIKPSGTEGYRTAEVTLGGIDCDALSSKTMEAKSVPGLYFIGEVVDVTGWLGGYNFQWAWSSGYAAGQYA